MKVGNPNKFKRQYIGQVNKLKIYFTPWVKYIVYSPDGDVLENRLTLKQAQEFCRAYKK